MLQLLIFLGILWFAAVLGAEQPVLWILALLLFGMIISRPDIVQTIFKGPKL